MNHYNYKAPFMIFAVTQSHHRPTGRRSLRAQRGVALVVTLWILAALTVVVWAFTLACRTETRIAGNSADTARADAAARAGLERAIVELERTPEGVVTLRQRWSSFTSESDGTLLHDERYVVYAEDEGGKLNLNAAYAVPPEVAGRDAQSAPSIPLTGSTASSTADAAFLEETLTRLVGPHTADAILDWRDQDGEARAFGAERGYYHGLPWPYSPRNGPIETVDELLLVRGVTRARLRGANGSETVSPAERDSTAGSRPLQDVLTIYSTEDNADAMGRPRLYLPSATRDQFKQALGQELSDSEIEAILRFRDGTPEGGAGIVAPTPLDKSPGKSPEKVSGSGPEAVADGKDAKSAGGSLNRPFGLVTTGDLLNVPMLRDRVHAISDRVTVIDSPTIAGRINLNTAPAEVLRALPGMSENVVHDILAYRDTPEGPFRSVGDLLALPSVSNGLYRKVADHLTTRSNAFHIVSEGMVRGSLLRRRIDAVVVLVNAGRPSPAPGVGEPAGTAARRGTLALGEADGRQTRINPPPIGKRAYVVYERIQ